jgi:mRNA interferase MazF
LVSLPARGDVWWGEAPDKKGRPYLVLTRDDAIPVLRTLLVAPVTRRVRQIPTELPLGPDEGLPGASVAAFDAVTVFPRSRLVRRMGALPVGRSQELCLALAAATDC